MSTPSPWLADALSLLGDDLMVHLDEAESLATQCAEWTEEDGEAARKVIGDLVLVIRGLLVEHRIQPGADCRTCASAWPCPTMTTVHAFLKDPQRQFIALVSRARDEREQHT